MKNTTESYKTKESIHLKSFQITFNTFLEYEILQF